MLAAATVPFTPTHAEAAVMSKLHWSTLMSALGLRGGQVTPGSKLIVGLGNTGKQYAGTRHNVGFWCLERLAEEHSIRFSRRHRLALVGEGVIEQKAVALAKPRTYVNRSGQALTSLLARYAAGVDDLLVIYDDLDLPPGKLRLRPNGGSGRHRGMKSIIDALGTQDFARIRVGIGRPPAGMDEVDYVLGTMAAEERERTVHAVKQVATAVSLIVAEDFDAAMNRFN